MIRIARIYLILGVAWSLAGSSMAQVQPLFRAHAHNDYEHERPLLDALDHGFMSIEADIYLVDGELLVAHDREDVNPSRTLAAMYLAPLCARAAQNGGRVYPSTGESLILLVDIKSEAEATYRILREQLEGCRPMLTRFTEDAVEPGAVTVIVSGNRPRRLMKSEPERLAAYDGRLEDLEAAPPEPASFIPLVSSHWNAVAPGYSGGALTDEQRAKLNDIVRKAHEQGRKLRFWATGDNPAVWDALYEAGVDLLNTDDLAELQKFLRAR